MKTAKPLGAIEHVIVLMYENRSFDNILGGLRPHGPDFDGVPPGWSNPVDPHHDSPTPNARVPAFQAPTDYDARTMPYPDPLEDHSDMMTQIDGGSMQGFLANYAKAVKGDWSVARNIMQYYAPGVSGNIPVTSTLADAYGVSDRYFGSGPVQTWPNRLFAHCATPGSYSKDGERYSYLNNAEYIGYPKMDGQLYLPSIFELLDQKNPTQHKAWKVYYDGEWPISVLVNYVYEHWKWDNYSGGNVFALRSDIYPDFFSDVAAGTLPAYSFIEPRYQELTLDPLKQIPPNSNHPGSATVWEGSRPIDIHHGEQLLADIYSALIGNMELFEKTLLIVTYDEHGGCFDHVPPPKAVSPFTQPLANFNYGMYGPRVPAIFINPYIKSGTVLRPRSGSSAAFDHTSIIATLRAQFDLGGPLTPRDASASLFEGLIGTELREPVVLPKLQPETHPDYDESTRVPEPGKIDRNSLNYVMYEAVLEKRRRLGL